MIDLTKPYKTADGREVRLAFEDNGIIHGHVKNPPEEIPDGLEHVNKWVPWMWDKLGYLATGRDIVSTDTPSWEKDMKLVEQVPSKQLSVTLYISHGGHAYLLKDMPDDTESVDIFAKCTFNFEIEKGADKVYSVPAVIKK